MNKIKTFMLLALTALAVASCSKDDLPGSSGNVTPEGRGIYLSFSDGADTRSTLQSSEVDYHDVKAVYLYVFEGTDGSATCVYDHNDLNVQWDQEGDISQKQWISVDLTDDETYTFLAVGVDDKAGEVYDFPKNMKGETLSNVVAAYTGTDKAAMATAQLFAGYEEAAVTDGKATVEITLRRKVAGVLAYLKNIPYKVEDTQVTDLKIKLGQKQHTQMALWSDSDGEQFGTGELADDDQYLFVQNLSNTYKADSEERYYVIPAKTVEKDGVVTLENSLLMGAFLLPIEAGSEPTLTLELWGNKLEGGTEPVYKVLKTYQITNNNETTFSIEENKLYSIGKKLSDASTDGDKPADLSGNILQVFVEEWCGHDVDNWFPTVQGPARIEVDYNEENYIFDAPGTTFTARIRAAEPISEWTMTVAYEQGEGEYDYSAEKGWIHFIGEDEQGNPVENVTTMTGTKDRRITVVLNDFAVRRELEKDGNSSAICIETEELVKNLKNDYRTAYIEIKTSGTANPYRLRVRQYNALTVYTSDGWRAAARLDYGCSFSLDGGYEMRSDTAAIGWGFFQSIPSNIIGSLKADYYDGEKNTNAGYERWQEGKNGGIYFPSSLMGKMRKEVIEINDQGVNVGTGIWYMPAYHEMWGIAHYVNPYRDMGDACQELFNLRQGTNYWCSTVKDYDISETLYIPAGTTNYMYAASRRSGFCARAMRKFND